MKTVQVIWISEENLPGITHIGYLPIVGGVKEIIGYNGFILHQQVSIARGERKKLKERYRLLLVNRKADESNSVQRYRGSVQPYWSTTAPWYIVTLNDNGSFGISLREQDYADLIVTSEQITPFVPI